MTYDVSGGTLNLTHSQLSGKLRNKAWNAGIFVHVVVIIIIIIINIFNVA